MDNSNSWRGYPQEIIDEVENIKAQIISACNPEKIIVFGSIAKGIIKPDSDVDLCVVMDFKNKLAEAAKIQLQLEAERPVDLMLYTPRQWEKCKEDLSTFAYHINREGIHLYDRQR